MNGLAVGVDLGATNVRVGIGDERGNILKKIVKKTDKSHGPEGVPAQIIRMIHSLIGEARSGILGIGMASIGPLDLKKGAIVNPANIPFEMVPLKEPIEKELNTHIILVNDCNAAVVAERMFGAGKGFDNVAYITLSTGIGGGAIVDGNLLLGKDGNACEVGHLVIDFEGRLECGCGKRGHWEAYCSGRNIPAYAKMFLDRTEERGGSLIYRVQGDLTQISAKILYEEAEKGDELSLAIVNSIGRLNAVGFANVINLYDPSVLTVGGALALEHRSLIINPIKRYINDYTLNRLPEITVTPLGGDAVLKGSIALVFKGDKYFP